LNFQLTILGTSAAVPYKNRGLAAQVLEVHNRLFLVDCGDATQFRMHTHGIKLSKIEAIFISHLHGDHCFGLPAVLTTLAMQGRTAPMHIFAPKGLKRMIDTIFEVSNYVSPYPIYIEEFDENWFAQPESGFKTTIYENKQLRVRAFPLMHRIPTCGYVFEEKQAPRNIIAERIAQYDIPHTAISGIKNGENFTTKEGFVIENEALTRAPNKPRSFAYASDTRYSAAIIPHILGVDLLFHEATFMHNMAEHAAFSGHSTAQEAATIAQLASAKRLIIGHFSARYTDLSPLLLEAKAVFENTELADDFTTYFVEKS
jgi:ribonuclease Z